jgi:predicted phosphodiesterase
MKLKGITDSTFIHVGDFGIGFTKPSKELGRLEVWNDFLKSTNNVMYVIRGNHDDPSYFNDKEFFDYDQSNIKFMPDYSVIEVEGKKILGVGGATSIDRVPRIAANHDSIKYGSSKRFWWSDEVFKLDVEKAESIRDVDIVVTHTCPNFVSPIVVKNNWPYIVKQFLPDDPMLEAQLVKEREDVGELCNILRRNNNIQYWFYGHFHQEYLTNDGACLFRGLEISQLYEHRSEYDADFEQEMNDKYGE